jgi:hypothetical protein
MSARKFTEVQNLARERGYGVCRLGRVVLWWRNRGRAKVYSSSGVSDAWDDIVLDSSPEKLVGEGGETTQGERQ